MLLCSHHGSNYIPSGRVLGISAVLKQSVYVWVHIYS